MRTEAELRKYQAHAVSFIEARPAAGLFLKPGLGKTIIALTLVRDLVAVGEARAMLVISSIRVIETVWRQEAAEWEHTRSLRVVLVRGTPEERKQLLRAPAEVYLINYENTVWLFRTFAVLPFDILCIDESSAYKDPDTKRFRSMRYAVKRFTRRYLLTGTPRPNSALDLWPQLYVLDEGERLGKTFGNYKQRFFYQADRDGYKWLPRAGAEERIKELISPLMLYLDRESYLELPPIVFNSVTVLLPESAMKTYKTFERQLFLKLLDERTIDAANAAVATMKLHQIANGAAYMDPEEGDDIDARPVALFHDAKIDALDALVEEAGGPVLVAYTFKHDLARLRTWRDAPHLGGGQEQTTEAIVDAWNAGELPILYVHPRSAAHGLNMQFGGNTLVFFSLTWSAEQYEQLIARLHRSGQDQPVIVHDIIAKGTVDVLIQNVVKQKIAGQANLLNALKEYASAAMLFEEVATGA